MSDQGRVVREGFVLTVDEVAAALTDTVLSAQLRSIHGAMNGGAIGAVHIVCKAFEGWVRWIPRLVFAGIPFAFGVYVLVAVNRDIGLLLVVGSLLMLLLVVLFERFSRQLGNAVDLATDPEIVRSGGRRLRSRIEQGEVEVLLGSVDAELTGDQLRVRAGRLTVTIPSVRAAWKARSDSHLVLAASAPGIRPVLATCVVLPLGGAIAAAIAGTSAT